MTTMKDKLHEQIDGLGEDAKAAMLIVADGEGKVTAFAPGLALPHAVELLGVAVGSIGKRMVPAAAPAAS